MAVEAVTAQLGEEIDDADEETFLLFSRPKPSQDLGMVDARASSLEMTIAGRDVTIHQSPGVLSSSRAGGTTGAVLWRVSPLFASYISTPSSRGNPLFQLLSSSTVLELGCGVSPLLALSLAPHVAHYVLSDQPYVHRTLARNLLGAPGNVLFRSLDWETDRVEPRLSPTGDFDLVLACDCVYNDALVRPFVQTCVDVCRLRTSARPVDPCVCLVAQQLRADDVFEQWMHHFHKAFRVWRFPDHLLPAGLTPDDGFVIHLGILRD